MSIDDPQRALARCREAGVELVIVDLEPGAERERWLEALRREGRPVLVAGAQAERARRGVCASSVRTTTRSSRT